MENNEKIKNVKAVLDKELEGKAVCISDDDSDKAAKEIADAVASLNFNALIPSNINNSEVQLESVDISENPDETSVQEVNLNSQEEKSDSSMQEFANYDEMKDSSEDMTKEVNTENEIASLGQFSKSSGDIVSVFGRRIKEIRQMDTIRKAGHVLDAQISLMSKDIIKTRTGINPIETKQLVKLIKDKNPALLTEEEINSIIEKAGLHFKDEFNLKDGYSEVDAKRMFLDAIKVYDEQYKEIDKAEVEFKKIDEEIKDSFDELLSNIDLLNELEVVGKQIEESTDENEIKELKGIYHAIYSVININRYFDKLNLKPIKILRKECKKDYDHVSKKALLALRNDKDNTYFGEVKFIREALDKVFPDLKEANKIFTYVLNKKILKNKTKKDPSFPSFLNYFILTLAKIINPSFKEDPKFLKMRDKIREAVETFK